jgi:hypothetical protein
MVLLGSIAGFYLGRCFFIAKYGSVEGAGFGIIRELIVSVVLGTSCGGIIGLIIALLIIFMDSNSQRRNQMTHSKFRSSGLGNHTGGQWLSDHNSTEAITERTATSNRPLSEELRHDQQ